VKLLFYKGSVLIAFIFTVLFLNWFNHPDLQYEGEKEVLGISSNVDVYTDSFGVPHVFAKNEKDLFFTAGYLAARERLFQLSMVAILVKGEMALNLGDEYLDTDIFIRTWRIHETAKKMVLKMKPENKEVFNNFCDGINYRINEIKNDLPIEFKIMRVDPSFWDPSIVAGYARMMAYEMQGSWKPEILYGAIAANFGEEKLKEIIPGYDKNKSTIASMSYEGFKPIFDKLIKEEFFVRNILGKYNASLGSNNWVLSGSNTKTGKPLLANDPHLAYTQPSRWFEIHLKGGRFDVSGVCIAGIPIPVIGQNSKVAWGFTNSMVDDLDFFIETINPNNRKQYKSGDRWLNMEVFEEKIQLKSGRDSTISVRMTHHGPVVSDIHPLLKDQDVALSMAWTGHWITNELDAWIDLNIMENWDDFSKGVRSFGVPGQNIVYADIEGNIGWRPAVFIPIRKEGFSMIPRPGHDPDYDWAGKVPFSEMPFIFNPKKGYIATANNKTINDFPYYISGLWADPSRADQINYRLDTMKSATIEDMMSMQLDQTSQFAKDILPYILETEEDKESKHVKRAFQFLKNWDFVEDVDSEAALVFNVIVKNLVFNLYGDEISLLGENYLEAFSGINYLITRRLREDIKDGKSTWVDDVRTIDKREEIREIIKSSVLDAVSEIDQKFGGNWSNWKWGDAHSLTHKHLFYKNRFINWLFELSVGPYRSGGSNKTPNAGGFSLTKPYKQTAGASMRRIVDFSNLNETRFILPTGQSGLPSSPHYRDQADLYHKGEYRKTWFSETYIKSEKTFKHLKLIPK